MYISLMNTFIAPVSTHSYFKSNLYHIELVSWYMSHIFKSFLSCDTFTIINSDYLLSSWWVLIDVMTLYEGAGIYYIIYKVFETLMSLDLPIKNSPALWSISVSTVISVKGSAQISRENAASLLRIISHDSAMNDIFQM